MLKVGPNSEDTKAITALYEQGVELDAEVLGRQFSIKPEGVQILIDHLHEQVEAAKEEGSFDEYVEDDEDDLEE